jgi:cytosine/adenosine deaminase-related metal-dependent hydrolase
MLVHNTYSTLEDINWAHLYSSVIYWCFCPNANLYIEDRLPDFQTFINSSCRIIIGTDSLASNHSLSVLEELKTISRHAPYIKLDILLKWGTLSGADFFGWKQDLGSLEKGKRPGINLITDVNTETLALTETSTVKPLFGQKVS